MKRQDRSSAHLYRRVGIGVLAAVGLSLAPAADAAPKKPNLKVSSVANPPTAVEAGKKLSLKITIANAGKGRAAPSSARVFLGWDEALAFGKVGSLGTISTPKLDAGKKKKTKAKLKVPDDAPIGDSLHVVACADDTDRVGESNEGDNCRAAESLMRASVPLDAIDLIEREFDEGTITLDEAALYLAYASSGDNRLPERFGEAAESFDSDALRRVAAKFDQLTAQTQAKLDPFFSPPIYQDASPGKARAGAHRGPLPAPGCVPGAGLPPAPSSDWTFIDTTHFRIWHPVGDATGATQVASVAEHVYNQETTLWRVPISDAAQPCNGGDGRTDVYMSQEGRALAQVVPFPPGESLRPAWMWIGPGNFSGNEFRDAFAHEFAHVVQLAYDYAIGPPPGYGTIEYGWLEEATATWAIDFVYAGDNYEHRYAKDYYAGAWSSPLGECSRFGCGNGYRDYLYFFFLSNKLGDGILGDVLDNTEASGSIEAVDDAAEFADQWPEFALHNLNQGDYNDYSVWDPGFAEKLPVDDGSAQPHLDVKLNGKRSVKTDLPPSTDEVGPKEYEWLSFSFDDPDVRKIELRDFGWAANPQPPVEAKVTAWYELANGEFVTEDLTGENEKTFCRDKEAEDVVRLVLFYANGKPTPFLSDTDSADHPEPGAEIEAWDVCEYPNYSGPFTGTAHYTSTFGLDIDANWSGSIEIEPFSPTEPHYYVISGTFNFSFSGQFQDCDVDGEGSETLPTWDMMGVPVMEIAPGDPGTDDPDTYQLRVPMPFGGQYAPGMTSNCDEPGDDGQPFDFGYSTAGASMVANADHFDEDGITFIPVPPDGLLSGSASAPSHGDPAAPMPSQTWTWNLVPE